MSRLWGSTPNGLFAERARSDRRPPKAVSVGTVVSGPVIVGPALISPPISSPVVVGPALISPPIASPVDEHIARVATDPARAAGQLWDKIKGCFGSLKSLCCCCSVREQQHIDGENQDDQNNDEGSSLLPSKSTIPYSSSYSNNSSTSQKSVRFADEFQSFPPPEMASPTSSESGSEEEESDDSTSTITTARYRKTRERIARNVLVPPGTTEHNFGLWVMPKNIKTVNRATSPINLVDQRFSQSTNPQSRISVPANVPPQVENGDPQVNSPTKVAKSWQTVIHIPIIRGPGPGISLISRGLQKMRLEPDVGSVGTDSSSPMSSKANICPSATEPSSVTTTGPRTPTNEYLPQYLPTIIDPENMEIFSSQHQMTEVW